MFKRIISLLLAVVLLLSSVAILGACSSKKNDEKITVGEWLTVVNEKFGMKEALNTTPYFKNIDKNNPYFKDVQIAVEWNVVDPKEELDVDAPLTWKQALITLVNAGNFVDHEESEDAKIEYACTNFDNNIRKYWLKRDIDKNRALSLLDTAFSQWTKADFGEDHIEYDTKDGVLDFTKEDSPVKDYGLNRKGELIFIKSSGVEIKAGDILLLPKSRYFRTVTTHKVVSVRSDEKYIYVTTTQSEKIAQANKNNNGNTTNVSKEDLYTALENEFYEEVKKYNISFLENENVDNGLHAENVIVPGDMGNSDVTIDEVFENMNTTETAISEKDNTIIKNTASNVIYDGVTNTMSSKTDDVDPEAPIYSCDGVAIGEIDSEGFRKIDEKVNKGFKISISVKFGSEGQFKIKISKDLGQAKDGSKQSIFYEFKISDVEAPIKINMNWGKIKYACAKVNFKTTSSVGISKDGEVVKYAYAPDRNSGKFMHNFMEAMKNKYPKNIATDKPHGAETIKIGSVDLLTSGIFRVCLDINFSIDVEGKVKISLTNKNTLGVEFKEGAVPRAIVNATTEDRKISADITGEATVDIGPGLYVVGLTEKVAGLHGSIGAGCSLNMKVTIRDNQMHKLEEYSFGKIFSGSLSEVAGTPLPLAEGFDLVNNIKEVAQERGGTYSGTSPSIYANICLDGKAYFIVNAAADTKTYLFDITKKVLGDNFDEAKLKVEFFNEDNGTFAHIHVDNFDFSNIKIKMGNANEDLCTFKYKDFDGEKPKETKANEENKKDEDGIEKVDEGGRVKGIVFKINTLRADLEPSGEFQIKVTRMPKKYDLKDVEFSSSNKAVATVDKKGLIKAVGPGNALITAKIKGTEYQAVMTVSVANNETIAFEGIALSA